MGLVRDFPSSSSSHVGVGGDLGKLALRIGAGVGGRLEVASGQEVGCRQRSGARGYKSRADKTRLRADNSLPEPPSSLLFPRLSISASLRTIEIEIQVPALRLQMAEQQTEPEAEQADAPQSPPLPTPHKPVAPGPRAARLQLLFDQSLAHMLGKISWENLEGCYPTIAAGAPQMLKGVRKTMVERLEGMCKVGFHYQPAKGPAASGREWGGCWG